MLGCAEAEHLSVHGLREVLHFCHYGLLCKGAALHPHRWGNDTATDWHVILWENELDLSLFGLLELQAQASSLEAKLEELSWQRLGQWLPPFLPISLTDGQFSFPFLGKQPSI